MGKLQRIQPGPIETVARTPARTESRIALGCAMVFGFMAFSFMAAGFIGIGIEAAIISAVMTGTSMMAERDAVREDARLPRAEASYPPARAQRRGQAMLGR